MPKMLKGYDIQNKTDKHAEILLYGYIGDWMERLDSETFAKDLNNLDVEKITLRINSPGGSIFDGFAMYNALRGHKAKIHVKIEALAASAASVMALAGDTIEMASNALFMIHNPWVMAWGEADDLRKQAELLDKIRDNIVNTYVEHSNLTAEEINQKMADETWYSAQEAIEAGFVHSLLDYAPIEAPQNTHDLSKFKNAPMPKQVKAKVEEEIETPVEEEVTIENDFKRQLSYIQAELDMMEV